MTKDMGLLLERLRGAKGYSNELDVAVEIALFEPDEQYVAIRANNAGTKVIYTDRSGAEKTHWARDWTISPGERNRTIKRILALMNKEAGE